MNNTSTRKPVVSVADTFGIAQTSDGRWFSLSEEAFSSGACLFDTAEEARKADDKHHAFMLRHHPAAKGQAPYVTRKA